MSAVASSFNAVKQTYSVKSDSHPHLLHRPVHAGNLAINPVYRNHLRWVVCAIPMIPIEYKSIHVELIPVAVDV